MKTLRYLCLAALGGGLLVGAAQAMNSVAVDEVLKLKNAGLGEDGIIAFIKNKNVNYDLSADDIVLLKNQGVSSAVLGAMLSSVGAPGSAPPQVAAPAIPGPAPSPVPTASTAGPTVGLPPGLSSDAAYFYQQLSPYGKWIMAEDNQWYWQPTVVVSPTWRPYWDQGHWLYTDSGWYWASDYPWGWAAFHYGRWRLHPLHGWMWLPDRVWAPAWVSWRSGGDYCGWAPLPPGTHFDVGGALIFNGRRVALDFDFGLDWHHYNFCTLRDMGEPRRFDFRRDDDRRRIFSRTTIINNYSVSRAVVENRTEVRVINRGIDPGRVATAKGRNIETVRIQELRTPAPNRSHERIDKDRKTIEVYRPHWGDQR